MRVKRSLCHRLLYETFAYGDGAIGAANLRMVEIAQKHNVPCKFPGSGGAVVGLVVDVESMTAMQHELERNGCVFTRLVASPPI